MYESQQIFHLSYETANSKSPAGQWENHTSPYNNMWLVLNRGSFRRLIKWYLLFTGKLFQSPSWLSFVAVTINPAIRTSGFSWPENNALPCPSAPLAGALPCHQKLCWSCSGTPCLHISARWTSARGCSRSPAPGSCRWSHCSAGTLQRCGTPAHGTRNVSPDCWRVWCSCLGPTLGHFWFGLHTTPHCDCSLKPGAFHLRRKEANQTHQLHRLIRSFSLSLVWLLKISKFLNTYFISTSPHKCMHFKCVRVHFIWSFLFVLKTEINI